MKHIRSSFTAVCFVSCLLLLGKSFALTSTVTPAFARFNISSQQDQYINNIAVTNNNDITLTYDIQITDVDVSTGSLLPKNTTSEITKQLLQTNTNTITIEPKKSAVIVVTAKNYQQLPPGGHYAALKIQPTNATLKTKNSNIQQAFSVPLFVIKEDGAVRAISTKVGFGSLVRIGSLPAANIIIKNTGNVDGAPRGFYSIIRSTETVFKQSFNDTSQPLFANQERTFKVAPTKNSVNFLGKYTAVVSAKIDGQEQPIIYTQSGWLMPWWFVGLIVGMAVIFVMAQRYLAAKIRAKKLADIGSERTPKRRRSRKGAKYEAEKQKIAKKTVVSDFGSTKGVK